MPDPKAKITVRAVMGEFRITAQTDREMMVSPASQQNLIQEIERAFDFVGKDAEVDFVGPNWVKKELEKRRSTS